MSEKGPEIKDPGDRRKDQLMLFGSVFVVIAIAMTVISVLLVLFVDVLIGLIIGSQVIFPVIFAFILFRLNRAGDE